jgi:hypothetical protein
VQKLLEIGTNGGNVAQEILLYYTLLIDEHLFTYLSEASNFEKEDFVNTFGQIYNFEINNNESFNYSVLQSELLNTTHLKGSQFAGKSLLNMYIDQIKNKIKVHVLTLINSKATNIAFE